MNKGIIVQTETDVRGPYVTSAQAEDVVVQLIEKYNLPRHIGVYSDGKRHIGTECSKIYKHLFPMMLEQEELGYVKATDEVLNSLKQANIRANLKSLTMKKDQDVKYIQLISLDILGIYLGGKLNLDDAKIDRVLTQLAQNRIIVRTSNNSFVFGNKPVNIEGKPLVKILKQCAVDKELKERKTPSVELGFGSRLLVDSDSALTYVKTGPLMRKDIYIALKTIAAKDRKPMYQVIEEMLLGDSQYNLRLLKGGK